MNTFNRHARLEEVESSHREAIADADKYKRRAMFFVDNLVIPEDAPIRLDGGWNHIFIYGWNYKDQCKHHLSKGPKYLVLDIAVNQNADMTKRETLAWIQDHFQCILSHPDPDMSMSMFKREPKEVYHGLAHHNGYKFIIKVSTPWEVEGCEVKEKYVKQYEVTCPQMP